MAEPALWLMSWREPGEGFFVYDPEDLAHPGYGKLGFEKLVFERRAREWYRAAGMSDLEAHFEASAAYWRWHATTIPYREVCRRRSIRSEAEAENRWRSGEGTRPTGFTKPELEFLADHFEGANDPIAAAIWAKVRAVLDPK